jgi:hypothetical protein
MTNKTGLGLFKIADGTFMLNGRKKAGLFDDSFGSAFTRYNRNFPAITSIHISNPSF